MRSIFLADPSHPTKRDVFRMYVAIDNKRIDVELFQLSSLRFAVALQSPPITSVADLHIHTEYYNRNNESFNGDL